ncbi:peroxiredoxin family protein [Miniimonas arenae]|uniref:Peroxiredoxin family protein n=2 Tax=Miniimonas arenae TaxID=676201 RepID=A0A5C5B9Z4_9MICO|nr:MULTISPECIES: peroxiredoxin family protein [Micrococcales]KXC04768.1 redoxin [Microbacterium hominis]TNU72997.1 peroxiredoxin family protein [Miniimonas arenae]
MTSRSATRRAKERQETMRHEQDTRARRRRTARLSIVSLVILAVVALVVMALLSARPEQSDQVRTAPDFTLPASDGTSVRLSDLRGAPVLLYFNEGAGCDACIVQMTAIEAEPGFADAGITVLPIVMNTAEQINAERERLGATSAFLLDDGAVSAEYDTLGTGMHEGLPGHGFVLIDADGQQVWSGDYPSMWIDADDLLGIALDNL